MVLLNVTFILARGLLKFKILKLIFALKVTEKLCTIVSDFSKAATYASTRPDWQAEAWCFQPVHLFIDPPVSLSVVKLANVIFWKRI